MCENYRGINFLNMSEKVYTEVLVKRVYRATEGLKYNEQGGF